MKRALCLSILVPFIAAGASYKDFYTVEEWKDPELSGIAYHADGLGNVTEYWYRLIPDGKGGYYTDISNTGAQNATTAFRTAIEASCLAACALAEAQLAQAQTDRFAERLSDLLFTNGLEITDANNNVMKIRFDAGALGLALKDSKGSTDLIDAKADKPFGSVGDDVTIEADDDGKLRLVGADNATGSSEPWWDDFNFYVPYLKGTGVLSWKKYGGYHAGVFGTMDDGGRRMLTLAGWTGGSECGTDLKTILTEKDSENRETHYVLTRYGHGNNAVFHYVPFGGRLDTAATNNVTGDDVTISAAPAKRDEESVTLGLNNWNYTYHGKNPLFLVNNGGRLEYIDLPSDGNGPGCDCTNKWDDLLEWIGDGEKQGDGLRFSAASLDEYLSGTLGYVYSTTPADLHFENEGSEINASFSAPGNWVDGTSLSRKSGEDGYEITGFSNASPCEADLSAMLAQPNGQDARTHLFLAKKTDSGSLHYVAVGGGVGGGSLVDGVTVVTNTSDGAVQDGLISLAGWKDAEDGKVLTKRGGAVAWEDGGAPVDDVTLEKAVDNDGEVMRIKGFDTAPKDSIPRKDENGNFVWGGTSSVTNQILAGAGIIITDNGGGAITISAEELSDDSNSGGEASVPLTVVTAARYDAETHTFQIKTRDIVFKGTAQDESEWTDVFTAVSHASEHGEEE